MKKIIFVLFLLLSSINNVCAKEKVDLLKCVDGDTVKILLSGEEKTLRFLAVDTPESVHPTKKVEYYGKEASEYTCNLVTKASKIEIEYEENSDRKDKYDRLLVWIFVDDKLLQDLLVTNGYAKIAYLYGDYKYTNILEVHEKEAKKQQLGIWNEEEANKFNPNSVKNKEVKEQSDLTLVEIILILVLGILLALLKKNKTYKKIKKLIK